MATGKVKWFNDAKGYAIRTPDTAKEIGDRRESQSKAGPIAERFMLRSAAPLQCMQIARRQPARPR
jgi:hypothetical protein